MILCVDSGNSRIKWGLHANGAWRETGAIDHADVAQLAPVAKGAVGFAPADDCPSHRR